MPPDQTPAPHRSEMLRCGLVPPTPGFGPCHREAGHDGPCAHGLPTYEGILRQALEQIRLYGSRWWDDSWPAPNKLANDALNAADGLAYRERKVSE
jgi:hypothetical protein